MLWWQDNQNANALHSGRLGWTWWSRCTHGRHLVLSNLSKEVHDHAKPHLPPSHLCCSFQTSFYWPVPLPKFDLHHYSCTPTALMKRKHGELSIHKRLLELCVLVRVYCVAMHSIQQVSRSRSGQSTLVATAQFKTILCTIWLQVISFELWSLLDTDRLLSILWDN